MNTIFRTYGIKRIDKNFKYDENAKYITFESEDPDDYDLMEVRINKPKIGLWASPINGGYNWHDFCMDAEFHMESLDKKVDFTIDDDSNILMINNCWDLFRTYRKYGLKKFDLRCFDWKRIQKEYDGVYLNFSKIRKIKDKLSKYNLTSWDADSICIWNLSKIKE